MVALVREQDKTPVDAWVQRCLSQDCPVQFLRLTWEGLCQSLPADQEGVELIHRYMANKTVSLRPAFNFRSAGNPVIR